MPGVCRPRRSRRAWAKNASAGEDAQRVRPCFRHGPSSQVAVREDPLRPTGRCRDGARPLPGPGLTSPRAAHRARAPASRPSRRAARATRPGRRASAAARSSGATRPRVARPTSASRSSAHALRRRERAKRGVEGRLALEQRAERSAAPRRGRRARPAGESQPSSATIPPSRRASSATKASSAPAASATRSGATARVAPKSSIHSRPSPSSSASRGSGSACTVPNTAAPTWKRRKQPRRPLALLAVELVRRRPVDPVAHEDRLAGQLGVHRRDPEIRVAPQRAVEAALHARRRTRGRARRGGARAPRGRSAVGVDARAARAPTSRRDRVDQPQLAPQRLRQPRPRDLDRHLPAVLGERRAVHLRRRAQRDGLGVDLGEHLLDRCAPRVLQRALGVRATRPAPAARRAPAGARPRGASPAAARRGRRAGRAPAAAAARPSSGG